MGNTLYRDHTKRSETDQEMWDSPLNSYLRQHQMGRAGTICTLPDMVRHVEKIGSLWWQYTNPSQATLGAIRFINGGIVGPSLTPLIDTSELFTNVAVEGLRSWHTLLAADTGRRTLYGDDHADQLLPGFTFGEYLFDQEGTRCAFTDGTQRTVPAGTVVAMLVIDRVPIYCPPDHFGLPSYYDTKSRISTVDYFRQADAIQQGWKKAVDAAEQHRRPTTG
ncbi:hypothetical protein ACFVYG_22395 [Streptomyces sp. NPDC058256]|uniref:hypothetical protein n=1 Tax=Streptomyces sp. NPDC058256 TaxID=3346408 RepID=UPI0036E55727